MASVKKTKTSKGEIRYRVRFRNPDLEQWRKTKAEADRLVTEVEHQRMVGTYIDPESGKVPFGEYIVEWHYGRTRIRPSTRSQQKSLIVSRVLPEFGDVNVGDMSKRQITRWVGTMVREGLSPSTIRQCWLLVNAVLEDAVDNDLIYKNPAAKVELPPIEKTEKITVTTVEVEQIAMALAELNPSYSVMTRLAGYTGLRFGEVTGLRVRKVFVDIPGAGDAVTLDEAVDTYGVEGLGEFEGWLRVDVALKEYGGRIRDEDGNLRLERPKTSSSERDVELDPDLVRMLASHYASHGVGEEGLLFTNTAGNPIQRSTFRRTWNRVVAEVLGEGVTFNFHWLRDSHVNMLREADVPLESAQERLGHASIVTTRDVYGSTNRAKNREASRALRAKRLQSGGAVVGLASEKAEKAKAQLETPTPAS